MFCEKCNTLNDEDAIFCKKCGNLLLEDYNKKQKLEKVKKVKTKTKIKKQKNKPNKVKKERIVERKTGFWTKFFIFLLIVIILGLLGIIGFVGYKYYEENYNIKVPNLVGMTYNEAELVLAKEDLKIADKEIKVTDESSEGIVVKQNKKANSKVKKDTVIIVYVGVLDDTYVAKNYIGKDVDSVIEELTANNINYNIIYKESDASDNTVIKQSVTKNTKIDKNTVITLTISKKKEEKQETVEKFEETEDDIE